MSIRALGMGALAAVIAVGALAAGVGTASARKPVLDGTLSCATNGTTTITPGILLTSSQLPDGKDKKPKYVTKGGTAGCGGTTTSGTQPTSFTLTGIAKGTSRLLVGGPCDATGRVSKTKIILDTGDKLKVRLTSELRNYAFDSAHQTSTPFPPCGSDVGTAIAFANGHAGDRIETRSTGVSTGKSYPGKTVTSVSVTTVTLETELSIAQSPNGITSLTGDPAYSTLTIG